jgi:hypothetical protein
MLMIVTINKDDFPKQHLKALVFVTGKSCVFSELVRIFVGY